jgi:hypothetical protein
MNTHLSPQEVVDALGGGLDPLRLDHARTCEACRRDISQFAELTRDLAAVDVPEPSPLFWTHFSERVHQAVTTQRVPVDAALSWWRGMWRPLAMLAATAAALAMVVVWRPAPSPVPTRTALGPVGPEAVVETTESMSDTTLALMQAAVESPLSWDEARSSNLTPRLVTVDAAIDQLTPAQAAELARLIRIELGGLE